jgi:hypothetical protein
MKKLGLALALTVMGATAASAQGVEFRLGGTDRGWDRSRERVIVRDRRDWDGDRGMRRGVREVDSTGSVGCRTTIVRREDSRGRMVKRTIRECD